MDRPIFVTGAARSGTSMVAGLLAQHGVWVGTSSKTGADNAKGWFENDLFLSQTRDGYMGTQGPVADDWKERWPKLMEQDGWRGERWLVKAMPWAWKYLVMFNPVVVFCWRPATQILKSQSALGWGEHPRRVLSHWDIIRDIRFKADCVDIPTERLARGDTCHTQQAFKRIGLTFDKHIARQWIEPSLWNRA